MKNTKNMGSFMEESDQHNPDVPPLLDRWLPTEGDSTDPLQDRLYKLQYHMFLCDKKFEKYKRYLQQQFDEQEEILKGLVKNSRSSMNSMHRLKGIINQFIRS
ncbi:hypothetical protein MA16_Dca019865 [Dendrobium catenatum]|uniref:Uncharacterized protein n=1 Tax=Dendrobium catenatum TaxID=906689 RepID=A0A2I0WXI4_9ASPA|nr:hypothetical protein MA16_Dca019865 [Dendrobium catenatum]